VTMLNTDSLNPAPPNNTPVDITGRRDVKGMTTLLATLRPGDPLGVTFRTLRYGVFGVHGHAVRSASTNTFMVGSLFIETNGKPDKTVMLLGPSNAVITADDPESHDPDREQLQLIVDELSHGDLVEATFVQHPHGWFSITGVAVQTTDGGILAVGSWFIAQDGQAAQRLHALTRLATAGHHGLPVPSRISSWEGEDDTATAGSSRP
jgi:hypothetical protein